MNNETTYETFFNFDDFSWDGMYLMYEGRHSKSRNFEELNPNCHKSRIGMPVPVFIARFKYGRKVAQKNRFIRKLCQGMITVEQYADRTQYEAPLDILNTL